MSIKLGEALKNNETNLDSLLKNLENKTTKNMEQYSLAYEIGINNEILTTMTRNPEIEKKSIKFISDLFKKGLKNSKNKQAKFLLEKII